MERRSWLLRRRLHRRRRRLWLYVSGRRRRLGLVVFALLVAAASAYWFFTNDARIRRQVIQYVARMTGGQVEVEEASFSLFTGIHVTNLRVWFQDDPRVAFFSAPRILLVYRPTALFRGRLEPTEITCVGPTVSLIQEAASEQWAARKIFPLSGRIAQTEGLELPSLPEIRLRDCELRFIDRQAGQLRTQDAWKLNLVLEPAQAEHTYDLSFERLSPGAVASGGGQIDLARGAVHLNGVMRVRELAKALPLPYRQWIERYKIAGELAWEGQAAGPGRPRSLVIRPRAATMEFPPEEGGLRLEEVTGKITLTPAGIGFFDARERLTARIAQAGGAACTLQGRYEGYTPDSAFAVSLSMPEVKFPLATRATAGWEKALADFHADIRPRGAARIDLELRRDRGGPLIVEGAAELKDFSASQPGWPGQIDLPSGKILFAGDRLELANLRGGVAGAAVEITGWLALSKDHPSQDIMLVGRDVALTAEVRKALHPDVGKVWDGLSPRGRADVIVLARRGPDDRHTVTTATIRAAGAASIEYDQFPYRLDGVSGQADILEDKVVIRSFRGKAGPMECWGSGQVVPGREGRQDDFQFSLNATNLPLDDRLARAIPAEARDAYIACGLSGRADVKGAVIRREKGGRVEWSLPVELKDATILHRRLPYRLDHAAGSAVVSNRRVVVKDLSASHGQAKIALLEGEVFTQDGREHLRCDLQATGVPLDEELYRVLPAEVRAEWDVLSPSGSADVSLKLSTELPPEPPPAGGGGRAASQPAPAPPAEYTVVVKPAGARIRYRHFPLPLDALTGQATFRPGKPTEAVLAGRIGKTPVSLAGSFRTGPEGARADLASLRTGPLEVTDEFLAAMPREIVQALGLRPGGSVALDLDGLSVRQASDKPPATTGASSRPAATQPAWKWSGQIDFTDVTMHLGEEPKRVTAGLAGRMASAGPPERLEAEAKLAVSRLEVAGRSLGRFEARIEKPPDSPVLMVRDISGASFGGKVVGFARVRLTEPKEYGLSLSVEGISLPELLKAGEGGKGGDSAVRGMLTGSLQLTGLIGDEDSRRGAGRLRIVGEEMKDLTILLGFLDVVRLTLLETSAFRAAEVAYLLRGEKLTFTDIQLRGATLAMIGAGGMDMKTKRLRLTFLSGPPRELPRVVGEALEALAGQLMTVRVTGTLSKPVRQVLPLRNLAKTLDEINNPTPP